MTPYASVVDIFWFSGMSCDGCTVALTGAGYPPLEKLLRGSAGLPRVALHHPFLSAAAGGDFLEPHRRALRAERPDPYIVVLEGSATDETLAGDGYWAALGTGTASGEAGRVCDGVMQPLATMEWIRALAPRATAAIAIGTCATWGGVPAAFGTVTGAMSLTELLGDGYRSTRGLPVINVPGCAPVGDNIMETLAALLLDLAGVGPQLQLDELGRPAWLFAETAHRRCGQVGYHETGAFAARPGDGGCLIELGCWGPVVQCNITTRGAINGIGGCMSAGGACIGCTMPGFPDRFTPFQRVSGEAAAAAGAPGPTPVGLRSVPLLGVATLQSITAGAGQPASAHRSAWTFPRSAGVGDRASESFLERWRVREEAPPVREEAPPARAVTVAGGDG